MARTPKVALTASAITLLCLGASLSASPQVLAETLGREVHAFSPMDPSTYPGNSDQEPPRAMDASSATRPQTTVTPGQQRSSDQAETNGQDDATAPATDLPRFDTADAETFAPADTPKSESATQSQRPRETSTLPEVTPTSPPSEEPDESPAPAETEADEETPTPDVDAPESLTVIVNKQRPLPEDYEPHDLVELPNETGTEPLQLREEAAQATERLFDAAQADGIELTAISAYRSFEYQQELYDRYIAENGIDTTNEMSAKPGHSEHQTGWALDVDTPDGQHTLSQSFGETDAGQWLADNAHEFGFVIRYPQDARDITGFSYEPWHLRYFGEQYAALIMDGSGIAETTFDLDPAPDYDS